MSGSAVLLFCAVIAIVVALTFQAANQHHKAADEIFNGAVEAD